MTTSVVWLGFLAFFLSLLWLDLGVLHRKAQTLSIRQALIASASWVAVALTFSAVIYGLYEYHWLDWQPGTGGEPTGRDALIAFITGYLLEWSLSVDNIFVIALIFAYLRVPAQYQYRVLFWGIVGAIVLRGAMIAMGTALIHAFDWMFYVFGLILFASALRMLKSDDHYDPAKSILVRVTRRLFPVADHLDGAHFFTRVAGRVTATPLFIALLLVDFADVVFAVDSIPAILAVTQDPFRVHLERLRDPGSACDVLRNRRPDGAVPLSQVFAGLHPAVRRHQDDADAALSHPQPALARYHPRDAAGGNRRIDADD